MEQIATQYIAFWGGIYSNWYKSEFEIDGIKYSSVEKYMMAEKARLFGDSVNLARIMESDNVRDISGFGRDVEPYVEEEWMQYRLPIVIKGIYAKFTQNPELEKQMLSEWDQGRRCFVEASPDDAIWGIFRATNDPKTFDHECWQGINLLGLALDFVAFRLCVEAGKPVYCLSLNLAHFLVFLPINAAMRSVAGCIDMLAKLARGEGGTYLDFDDWMHGGETQVNALESCFAHKTKPLSIYWDRFLPSDFTLDQLILED